MASYFIQCGNDPAIEFPDDQELVIACAQETVVNCGLPKWREQALVQQLEKMPRSGFAFTDNEGNLIRVERVA